MHGKATLLIAVLTVALMACAPLSAMAQRTMKGQHAVGAEATGCIPRLGDLGLCLNYSQYLLNAYWQVAAYTGNNHIMTSNGIPMEFIDCTIEGGYMHRLVSTRSRSLSLYAGGGAFIGYEFYDPRKELPATIYTNLPTGNFLYGISPRIEAEFFLTRQMAITLGTSAMVNFSSPLVKLRPQLRIGLRIDI